MCGQAQRDKIEFNTLRKHRAYYSNYVHSLAIRMGLPTLAGERLLTLAGEEGKQFFTNSPIAQTM
jgi:hypothetical protein